MSNISVIKKKKNQVGFIRLNRPEQSNALSTNMLEDIASAVDAFDNDESIRAIVITSSGDYFTSGVDLKEFSEKTNDV